jgi:hypothetical protein
MTLVEADQFAEAKRPKRAPLSALLRGDPALLSEWVEGMSAGRLALCLGVILAGAGSFGAAVGMWRSPMQAAYVATKLPSILVLTTFGNALLNAMLAPLLGLNLGLRQTLLAILMSFTIAAAILGSFSPLVAFMVWNMPPMSSVPGLSGGPYRCLLLANVGTIAFAGVTAHLRLVQLLRQLSGNAAIARRVLLAWLAGNLFLGAQLSWVFRPFIGAPNLPVEFLRANPLHGNFYETVFHALRDLL